MKENLILLVIIFLFYSCDWVKKESDNNDRVHNDSNNCTSNLNDLFLKETEDTILPIKIDGNTELSFKFHLDTSGYFLKTINVYSSDKLIQRIEANKEISGNYFQLIDWNFDGCKDICVRSGCGSGGCGYWIWNYSQKSNNFIYNKELSGILGLEMDCENQFIIFHYRNGYSEEFWDSLKYVNDKLQFVKGLHRERWNDRVGVSWEKNTYSRMINNVIVTKVDSSKLK
jgi:hypothetical protein